MIAYSLGIVTILGIRCEAINTLVEYREYREYLTYPLTYLTLGHGPSSGPTRPNLLDSN